MQTETQREIRRLREYAPNKKKFDDYLEEVINTRGVQLEGGYTCYVGENIKIAKIIPEDKIVVDVGCSFAFQQVLYRNHKGYIGIVDFDNEAKIFHGEIINMRDIVIFQGETPEEIKSAFVDSVENYLAFCEVRCEKPEKPFAFDPVNS